MSWRDGDNILGKGLPILEAYFPEETERAIYLSGFINALCDEDFDYIQFREARTPHDILLDYMEKRDDVYDRAFTKVAQALADKTDRLVLSHYLTVARRNIKRAELEKLKSSSCAKEEAFQALWKMSSEYIDDDESLYYYTQSLVNCFLFTADERDALGAGNESLVAIIEQIKKEEEATHERLQKNLKKTKNLQELDETFKKLEARVKRSLTALSKRSKGQLSGISKAVESATVEPALGDALSEDEKPEPYIDPGFSGALNDTNKQHIQLVAEKTGHVESEVQAILQAYEECLLEDLENNNRTQLLTIMSLRAHFKEAKPERKGPNFFTGEEMLFRARPAVLKVKAHETDRLKAILTTVLTQPPAE